MVDVDFAPRRRPPERGICIVLDVVRATTTILQALANGFQEARCFVDVEAARAEAKAIGSGAVLAGERQGLAPPGFPVGNSPRAFAERDIPGDVLVFSTSNGTRAIEWAARGRCEVLIGALTNLSASADAAAIRADEGGLEVRICCAGIGGRPCLDDAYAAGLLVASLRKRLVEHSVTDAARLAELAAGTFDSAEAALRGSAGGRALQRIGQQGDLLACSRRDELTIVPRAWLEAGRTVVRCPSQGSPSA